MYNIDKKLCIIDKKLYVYYSKLYNNGQIRVIIILIVI